jgi:predicted metal-dependent hydrolase
MWRRLVAIFDPFNDRTARDIRNSLSTALVAELTGLPDPGVEAVANQWLERLTDPVFRAHIRQRTACYRQVIQETRHLNAKDPRCFVQPLWNAGLFFELHELLESFWRETRGRERTAIKGLIQAAGVYVHSERGNLQAARGLAVRARRNLIAGLAELDFVPGAQGLVECLANPQHPPPKLG